MCSTGKSAHIQTNFSENHFRTASGDTGNVAQSSDCHLVFCHVILHQLVQIGNSPVQIIDMIYEKNPVEDLTLVTDSINVSDENSLKYLTGITDGSLVSEAAISGPMIGSIPYSMVVVRVKDKKDTATVAQQMKDNINLRRWVCVEADTLTVVGYDDVIMLFMINSENYGDVASTDGMKEAFKSICGGTLDVDL